MSRFFINKGERVRTNVISSVVVGLQTIVRYLTKSGHIRNMESPVFTTVDTRTEQAFFTDQAQEDGEIVSLLVNGIPGTGPATWRRGQTWLQVNGGEGNSVFAHGYIYSVKPLTLGTFDEPGPGGGEGFRSWVPAFAVDRAGNATAVDVTLAATNAYRKIHGYVWYYHSDGTAASRTFISARLANIGLAKPTGFTTTGDNGVFWALGGDITLTVNEEGLQASLGQEGKDGLSIRNDNGARTVESSATLPAPWPYTVVEDDLAILRFPAITLGEAGDTHSAYILIEEWLVI